MHFKLRNEVFTWLYKDLISYNKKIFFFSFLMEFVGMGRQVAAYGLLFKYVNALEKSTTFNLLAYSVDPKASTQLLVLVAVATSLLFVLSSLSSYYANVMALNLSRHYDRQCSERIVVALYDYRSKGATKLSRYVIKKVGYDQRLPA